MITIYAVDFGRKIRPEAGGKQLAAFAQERGATVAESFHEARDLLRFRRTGDPVVVVVRTKLFSEVEALRREHNRRPTDTTLHEFCGALSGSRWEWTEREPVKFETAAA